jgi:diguanylate cyclase (GGDEF)-like protein/PAS domain S-box-containing protein
MPFHFHLAGIILLATTILCAYLALMIWIRQVRPGGLTFGFLLLSLAVWTLAAAMEDGSIEYAFKYTCSKLSYLGIATSPALLLMFALDYSRNSNWLSRRNVILLWIIPVVSIFMAFTNEKHLLLWSSVVPSPGTNGEILIYNHAIYFWIHVAFSYVCLLTASILLIRTALLFSKKVRSQVYILFFAAIIPWIGNVIYVSGLSPIQGLDLTPISFAISVILMAWSIFRLQLFGIIPVARDLVIETASDGVVVVDNENRILDANAAALRLLSDINENVEGMNLHEFLQNLPDVDRKLMGVTQGRVEVTLKSTDLITLDVNITPMRDQNGLVNGRILVMRDITDLKNIQNNEREQRLLASSLSDIASALNSLRDVNEVLDRVLLDVNRVVPHDSSSIALLDENNFVTFVRYRGYEKSGLGRVLKRLKLHLNDIYNFKQMYKSHQPMICNDTRKDPNWIPIKNSEWIRSFIGAPILSGGRVIGFINLDGRKPGMFLEKSASWLQAFASHAALAIENARLFERLEMQAITDNLTGLYNQRYFEEVAAKEIQRSIRYKKPLSLIMMDIDHFKSVNDQFGHRAGDQVLQLIAKTCKNVLRKMDVISRYGGEEFTVLLPETDLGAALLVADRLRESIASTPLVLTEGKIRVTCSMGVADYQSCPFDMKEFNNCADKALYEAKRAGRNTVRPYSK